MPDWLATQRSKQGLALGQLKALTWMARAAGLPALLSTLQSSICTAFSTPTHPSERRESVPFSLSFVVWLEQLVCDPQSSESEVLQIGTLLLVIWSSLC